MTQHSVPVQVSFDDAQDEAVPLVQIPLGLVMQHASPVQISFDDAQEEAVPETH